METKQENVIRADYSEIMQKSYIDYAMSVIISRALPDVRDGLKRFREERCMICMSWGYDMTGRIENAPVSWAIPWVNTTPTATAPFTTPLW